MMKLLPLAIVLFASAISAQPVQVDCDEIRPDVDRTACRAALLATSGLSAERRVRIAALRTASGTEASAALREYSEALVAGSELPLIIGESITITSGPGGIWLTFEIAPSPPVGIPATSPRTAFYALTTEERRARWRDIVCRPAVEALVERHGLFSASLDGAGVMVWAGDCFPPDERVLIQHASSTRMMLYQWQWDLTKLLSGERAELPLAEYRQAAERMGLRDIWPLIREESEFESRFREWLETQVLSR